MYSNMKYMYTTRRTCNSEHLAAKGKSIGACKIL